MIDTEKLIQIAKKSDAKLAKRLGYHVSYTEEAFRVLRMTGRVEVGARRACGRTDPSAHIAAEWVAWVKAARKAGAEISEEPVKHRNAYATLAGGFWSSVIYSAPVGSFGLARPEDSPRWADEEMP